MDQDLDKNHFYGYFRGAMDGSFRYKKNEVRPNYLER